jgi:hypothetical protein
VRFYFRSVFYTFLGIQRHIICNFWINRTIDMIFQSFKLFLFLKPNSNSVLTEGCHVLCADWPVPLRVDHGLQLSDQSGYEQPRSDGTVSVYKTKQIHWIWIWRSTEKRRKILLRGLGFQLAGGDEWLGSGRWRGSGGSQGRWRCGWCSEDLGELEYVVEVLNRVQQRGGRVTGVAPRGSDLRVASASLFCGIIR